MSLAALRAKIVNAYTPSAASLIERAYRLAEEAHRGQKRKTGDPYISHPYSIALGLIDLKLDEATIAAALLHDVVEDSDIPLSRIQEEFGEDVAFLVDGVTKLGKLKYRGIERLAESLRKMFLAIARDIRVVLIKLIDRMHNMETLEALPAEKRKRIALETLEIFAPLADRLGLGAIKAKLEDLAFPYIYPEEYRWLETSAHGALEERAVYIEKAMPLVLHELEREQIPVLHLDARAKHKYSLWRKLQKYDMDIAKIYDLVALRVIVPTTEDCYRALGTVHARWHPLPGKIKDYIALPKPNGYQSLHTTVFGPEGKIIELQIRTEKMHEEAEHGIAAHWSYSEQKSTKAYRESIPSTAEKKEIEWVSQLKNWQKDVKDPREFLNALKINFFSDRIFALTPRGDPINLPEGATALDFAYHVHSAIGSSAAGARVNGRMARLDHVLANLDIVEIIRAKNQRPSPDWLAFVKTSLARKHIASTVRRAEENRRFQAGRGKLLAEVRVVARDRLGLLNDLTSVIRSFKIVMRGVATEREHRAYPLIVMNCPVRSNDELRKLILKLKEVKGVEEVSYKITE